MRRTTFLLIVIALMIAGSVRGFDTLRAQGAPAFDVAGTDAKQVAAFLKTLQSAVAVDNRLKVATLVDFPLEAWAGGAKLTVRNDSEFQARYGQIFNPDLRQAIASAKVDALFVNQQGVMIDNGRVCLRPVAERKNALKIVAINEPGTKQ